METEVLISPSVFTGSKAKKREDLPFFVILKFQDRPALLCDSEVPGSPFLSFCCVQLLCCQLLCSLRLPCFWCVLLISLWRSGPWIQQEKPPAAGRGVELDLPRQKVSGPPSSMQSLPPKQLSTSAPPRSPTGLSLSTDCSPGARAGPRRWWAAIFWLHCLNNQACCPFFLLALILLSYPSVLSCPVVTLVTQRSHCKEIASGNTQKICKCLGWGGLKVVFKTPPMV